VGSKGCALKSFLSFLSESCDYWLTNRFFSDTMKWHQKAGMVELVDTPGLGPGGFTALGVQVPLPVP
jgi:hypothetical protein